MRRIFLLLLAVPFLTNTAYLFAPITAHACSCAESESFEEALANADAVFSGEVTEIQNEDVSFDTGLVWKGPLFEEYIVTTAEDESTCGYPFKVGEWYLVYAFEVDGVYSTNICSRTSLLDATDDLVPLGQGENPSGDVAYEENEGGDLWFVYLGIGIGCVVFFGFLYPKMIKKA